MERRIFIRDVGVRRAGSAFFTAAAAGRGSAAAIWSAAIITLREKGVADYKKAAAVWRKAVADGRKGISGTEKAAAELQKAAAVSAEDAPEEQGDVGRLRAGGGAWLYGCQPANPSTTEEGHAVG